MCNCPEDIVSSAQLCEECRESLEWQEAYCQMLEYRDEDIPF